MKKVKLTVLVTVVVASALATAAFASTKTSTIWLRPTAVGTVLVGANGRTLYLFTADKGTKSVCYGQCATYWPPLIAGSRSPVRAWTRRGSARRSARMGSFGSLDGHPLDFFQPDNKAGSINGQGFVHFRGAWWGVSAAGAKVMTKHALLAPPWRAGSTVLLQHHEPACVRPGFTVLRRGRGTRPQKRRRNAEPPPASGAQTRPGPGPTR